MLDGSNPPPSPLLVFFWNSLLLNGLNRNISNIAYSDKFSKFGEKKNALSKIAAPGPISSISFDSVLSNKDESQGFP